MFSTKTYAAKRKTEDKRVGKLNRFSYLEIAVAKVTAGASNPVRGGQHLTITRCRFFAFWPGGGIYVQALLC